ncbi:hypothetical protein GCM10023116_22720 [Kistimonas scapharcae]|uniref:Uncharacterized protein n=1 Tax=Kistimonas scapharcae TaxID=1036133 RepID=A0ABP8V1V4_9GAMM
MNVAVLVVNIGLVVVMGFAVIDKACAVDPTASRYSDLPPSYEEAISTSYYDSPPSYAEAVSTSYYGPPPSYEEAISTSYYDPPPSYEEATSTSYYNPPPSYEKPSLPSYDWPTIHYEAPPAPAYYDYHFSYEESDFPSYYGYLSDYDKPTYTTNYGTQSSHESRPYSAYQLLPSALGYRKANCGRADDWSSHHICCSEPGASENSVWAAAPGREWQCIEQPRSNCESSTRIWDNGKKVLTQNTMPSYCKARGKGAVLFDGRPPPISKRVIDL